MRVRIEPVRKSEKPELFAELQDYIDGFRPYDEGIKKVGGVYEYGYFDAYWEEEGRWPFWAVVGDKRAGFALVRIEESGDYEMAEFYIRPEYRRGGYGLDFAGQLLARFPGVWLISEFAENLGAVKFWHKVITPYSFTEESYVGADSGKQRLLQRVTVE
jgi:predicted acetyltransferase